MKEDIKSDIEKQDCEKKSQTVNSDETASGTPNTNETAVGCEDNSKFSSSNNVDQQVQAVKGKNMSIQWLEMVSKPAEKPMDLIVNPLTEQLATHQDIANGEQVIEVPYIDFIFGVNNWHSKIVSSSYKFKTWRTSVFKHASHQDLDATQSKTKSLLAIKECVKFWANAKSM